MIKICIVPGRQNCDMFHPLRSQRRELLIIWSYVLLLLSSPQFTAVALWIVWG